MGNTYYRAEDIALTQWPELKDLGDGKWERVWEIDFEHVLEDWNKSVVETTLSEDGFHVSVVQSTPKAVTLRVVTDEWGWADRFYASTFRMLVELERQLGPISFVNGQPKTIWWPWRFPGGKQGY